MKFWQPIRCILKNNNLHRHLTDKLKVIFHCKYCRHESEIYFWKSGVIHDKKSRSFSEILCCCVLSKAKIFNSLFKLILNCFVGKLTVAILRCFSFRCSLFMKQIISKWFNIFPSKRKTSKTFRTDIRCLSPWVTVGPNYATFTSF